MKKLLAIAVAALLIAGVAAFTGPRTEVSAQLLYGCASDHSYFGHADTDYYHYHWTATPYGPVYGIYAPSGPLVPGTCLYA